MSIKIGTKAVNKICIGNKEVLKIIQGNGTSTGILKYQAGSTPTPSYFTLSYQAGFSFGSTGTSSTAGSGASLKSLVSFYSSVSNNNLYSYQIEGYTTYDAELKAENYRLSGNDAIGYPYVGYFSINNSSTTLPQSQVKLTSLLVKNKSTTARNIYIEIVDSSNNVLYVTPTSTAIPGNTSDYTRVPIDFTYADNVPGSYTGYKVRTYYITTWGTYEYKSYVDTNVYTDKFTIKPDYRRLIDSNITNAAHFANNVNLENALIPSTIATSFVISVSDAFSGCTALTHLTYEGTINQLASAMSNWDSNWNRGSSLTEIQCTNGIFVL